MTRMMTVAASVALLLGSAGLAAAGEDPATSQAQATGGNAASTSDKQIRDDLTMQGYTVQRMKRDGDKVNVTATKKDGTTSKLLVDAQTGKVTQAADDDDDDDDD